MKKQKLTKLSLKKNVISRLQQKTIKGGELTEGSRCEDASVEITIPCHIC